MLKFFSWCEESFQPTLFLMTGIAVELRICFMRLSIWLDGFLLYKTVEVLKNDKIWYVMSTMSSFFVYFLAVCVLKLLFFRIGFISFFQAWAQLMS